DLIPYKYKGQERLRANSFYPSFGDLIKDFESIIRCQGCQTFKKQYSSELCSMCDTFLNLGLLDRIIDSTYVPKSKYFSINDFKEQISIAAKKIYGFDTLKLEQKLAIERYIQNHKDTFVLMPTGSGKSLYFVLSAVLFDGLTIVISPLTALMENQVVSKIPSAALYASTMETSMHEEKIFEEIIIGFLK
ncbi:18053_t:CDS:2, partial [Gigaspora margarita]